MSQDYGQCIQCNEPSTSQRKGERCRRCYRTFRASSDYVPLRRGRRPTPVSDRVLSRIAAGANGCWIWTGQLNNQGYGAMQFARPGEQPRKRTKLAHRVSYELLVGPIPDGLTIDHLCMVRRCINPGHLEVVTSQENALRSPDTLASRWGHRTHCERGHEFTTDNTILRPRRDNPVKFYRDCRQCRKDRSPARAMKTAAAKGGAR